MHLPTGSSYRVEEPPELAALQTNCWDPLLAWINERYKVDVTSSTAITGPQIPEDSRRTLAHHLETHSDWALIGKSGGFCPVPLRPRSLSLFPLLFCLSLSLPLCLHPDST